MLILICCALLEGKKNLVAVTAGSFTGKLPWLWLCLNEVETHLIFQTGTSWTSGPTFSVPVHVLELADSWSYRVLDEEGLSKQAFVFCSILVPDQGLGCCLIFCVVKCQQVERGCVPIQGIDLKAATCQWARKQLFQTPGMSHLQRAAGLAFCSPTCSLCASLRAADCSLGLVTVTDYRK